MLTKTLIAGVVMAAKVYLDHTLLLAVTLPFGTITQLDPFQYCTSNAVMPYCVKVVVSFGSVGAQ